MRKFLLRCLFSFLSIVGGGVVGVGFCLLTKSLEIGVIAAIISSIGLLLLSIIYYDRIVY